MEDEDEKLLREMVESSSVKDDLLSEKIIISISREDIDSLMNIYYPVYLESEKL